MAVYGPVNTLTCSVCGPEHVKAKDTGTDLADNN